MNQYVFSQRVTTLKMRCFMLAIRSCDNGHSPVRTYNINQSVQYLTLYLSYVSNYFL